MISSDQILEAAGPATWLEMKAMGFRWLAALFLATFVLIEPASAQTPKVVNQLSENADLVTDVKQVCPAPRGYASVGGYELMNVEHLKEDFGSASVYNDTANFIRTAWTSDKNPVVLFTTGKADPKRHCTTLLVLNAGKEKVRFDPSVRDGDFRSHLPQIVSDEVDRLLAECLKNPGKKRRDYLIGDYLIATDGTIVQLENSFNCDSAVMTSISAFDIAAGNRAIGVAYVHDALFLFEVAK